jgi:acetyltransferase-like isoleucine patch superfamily enzyme
MNLIQSIRSLVSAFRTLVTQQPGNRELLNGKVILYKNTVASLHPAGTLQVDEGIFEFNKPWTEPDPFPSLLSVAEGATLLVKNTFFIYSGARVYVNKGATLILGSGYINNNLNLTCFDRIEIGHNVAISVNVSLRDSDNHTLMPAEKPMTQPIKIGNNVWIGMNVTILKGVEIGDGAVIAAGAVVNKRVPPRCLAGGVPARIIKENIDWY